MSQAQDLLHAAGAMNDELLATRRDIHQHPELRYEERRTSALVAERLRGLDIDVRTGVAETGVVGLLQGGSPGKTVLLRADMDALPIVEAGERAFCSANVGVMHACGHDAHTAILLAAARMLAERRQDLRGNVKFMFQPAEEGGAGAPRMIEAGLLDNPQVDAAFALHVAAANQAGNVAISAGPRNAASDTFTITVRGRGGHAARPEMAVDPIVIGSHIVVALQTLVSREAAPAKQCVVTVGSFHAGATHNVIPPQAVIEGTVRTYDPALQDTVERRLTELAQGVGQAMRAQVEVDYQRLYPPLINHEAGAQLVRAAAEEVLGAANVEPGEAGMGGEDFAFVLQRVPGAMFGLGVRHPDWKEPRPTHSPLFDLDERALPVGAAVMAATAMRFLAEG